jgi:hypothetical protein
MRGGFDIGVESKDFTGQEDRRWLGSRLGWDQCRSITLDVSAFLPAHLSAKGAIPGGTVLAKLTAGGLYVPYDTAGAGGAEVAAGFLFTTTKVGNGSGSDLATAPNVGTALYWGPGIVKESFLPVFTGTALGELDADARTLLSNFIKFEA